MMPPDLPPVPRQRCAECSEWAQLAGGSVCWDCFWWLRAHPPASIAWRVQLFTPTEEIRYGPPQANIPPALESI